MFFGLPLRTTITTTDWVRMPLVGLFFHLESTSFASTSFCTSGSSERCTTSAFWPPITARAWSPDAPYAWLNTTFLPLEVLAKSEVTCLLACSRMEKPTRLILSPALPAAPELPPHAVSAIIATAAPTTAVFHL